MKKFLFLLVCLASTSAFAADIEFSGDSAKFMYLHLTQRPGTHQWTAKSLLGRDEQLVGYQNLLECMVKHGKVFGDSYQCTFPGTSNLDIKGSYVLNLSQDDLSNAVSNVNNAVFLTNPLKVGGVSAARLYSELVTVQGDPTAFHQTGMTKLLHTPFDGAGVSEIYCQVNHNHLFGDSYACLVGNVAMKDSNAPTTVVPPDSNNGK